MDAGFWHERWDTNQIAFHEGAGNALLVKHFGSQFLTKDTRVFLPLCGKTRDFAWLLAEGYRVVGAELSATAIDQLFAELAIVPEISETDDGRWYRAPGIEVFVGDIFALTREALGSVDVVYDRAALVALPEEMRKRYTRHLMEITDTAPQFLICFEYDQDEMSGPPFSVTEAEVRAHYTGHYTVSRIEQKVVNGRLKGLVDATENAWLLR